MNLTTADAAEATGLDTRTIQYFCDAGTIKATKFNRSWSITKAELKRFIRRHNAAAKKQNGRGRPRKEITVTK